VLISQLRAYVFAFLTVPTCETIDVQPLGAKVCVFAS
jgi:hypothetical protein